MALEGYLWLLQISERYSLEFFENAMITTAVFKDLNSTFINWDEIQIEAVKMFLIYISTYIYLLPGGFYVHRSI